MTRKQLADILFESLVYIDMGHGIVPAALTGGISGLGVGYMTCRNLVIQQAENEVARKNLSWDNKEDREQIREIIRKYEEKYKRLRNWSTGIGTATGAGMGVGLSMMHDNF